MHIWKATSSGNMGDADVPFLEAVFEGDSDKVTPLVWQQAFDELAAQGELSSDIRVYYVGPLSGH